MQVSSECIMPLIVPDIGNLCKIFLFVQVLCQMEHPCTGIAEAQIIISV